MHCVYALQRQCTVCKKGKLCTVCMQYTVYRQYIVCMQSTVNRQCTVRKQCRQCTVCMQCTVYRKFTVCKQCTVCMQ